MTIDSRADSFGHWLNLTMENRSIRGRDLARKIKVTESAVSAWRSGRSTPNMDACIRLGKALDLDPLRVAVTAGRIDGSAVGVKALPMPEPTVRRVRIKAELAKIRGLTNRERQHLIDTYDNYLESQRPTTEDGQ